MSSMLVHDLRLMGRSPSNMADNVYEVDDTVSISHAIGWIDTYAKSCGGLDNLYIMCHGYESTWDMQNQRCVPAVSGGLGLQLCYEGLSLYNVSLTRQWAGDIGVITLFACAPADTATYNAGTAADGMRFCGEWAMLSQAQIIAATQTQFYTHEPTFWQWVWGHFGSGGDGQIDFGDWEGPVYSFSPVDGSATCIYNCS